MFDIVELFIFPGPKVPLGGKGPKFPDFEHLAKRMQSTRPALKHTIRTSYYHVVDDQGSLPHQQKEIDRPRSSRI